MNLSNICICGNDNRLDYVAQKFYNMGYDVCRNLSEGDENSIIVLAPPVSDKALAEIAPRLCRGQSVYGGAISNRFRYECEKKDVKCIDYLKIEEVTEKNAELTAKGIIKEAESFKNIESETKCLVCGFGYCGKAIATDLKHYTERITVMVRRKELKTDIEKKGYEYLNMDSDKLNLSGYDFIFNTVPALILTEERLKGVTEGIILDIASAPGGTDFSYCRNNNIRAVLSLGIPGKIYPQRAGEIIAEAIISDLNLI